MATEHGVSGGSASSYLDHYSSEDFRPYLRAARPSGSHGANMIEVAQPAGDFSDPPVTDLVLIQNLNSYRIECDFGGGRRVYESRPGMLALIPAGAPTTIKTAGENVFRALSIPGGAMAEMAQTLSRKGDLPLVNPDGSAFLNPTLFGVLTDLWGQVSAPRDRQNSFYVDSAIVFIIAELKRSRAAASTVTGGLSPRQLALAMDFMAASMAEEISLAQLAAMLGITKEHFCRAFRISTGEPPHRWLINRRLDEARLLVTDTSASMTAIALDCGFGDSSQFARSFKARFGMTPTEVRRRS